MKRLVLAGTALSMLIASSPALAQRTETSIPAVVAVSDRCALTPVAEVSRLDKSTPEVFGAALGVILGGIAGELVKTGVNAAGDALDAASREQGFAAEGATSYLAGQIEYSQLTLKIAGGSETLALPPTGRFVPGRKCLHLFVQGATGSVDAIFSDGSLTKSGSVAFDWLGDDEASIDSRKEAAAELVALGVNSLPDLYAEILLLPGKEGFVAKPMLIWYRAPLKGAPKGPSPAEMHLLFSTPAFDAEKPGIGTGFAGARIGLPRLEAKKVLTWDDLKGVSSVTLPLRPTTGFIDGKVSAFNTAVASVGTAEANLGKAESAQRVADRLAKRDPKSEDAKEALIIAKEGVDEARMALALARLTISNLQAVPAGATNTQARIVIIRNADKFGMALAKALKGQADAAGKAATDSIAPKADWTAEDTGYLTAIQTVEAKQKAYDVALASGDAAATLVASHDLRLAKAKANEAAVTSKRTIPYPALLN